MRFPLKLKYTLLLFFLIVHNNVKSQTLKDNLFSKNTTPKISNALKIADENLHMYPDTAFVYYKRALDLSIKEKSNINEAYSLLNIGVCLDMKGEYKEALKHYLEAKDIYKSKLSSN